MPRRKTYPAAEAARALGISLDTLRRWDRAGRIRTERDAANRRLVPAAEIERLRGGDPDRMSARNHFRGVVREVRIEGLLAQIELDVTEPAGWSRSSLATRRRSSASSREWARRRS